MPELELKLRNSLLTVGAHAQAIAQAMHQLAAGVDVNVRVSGIKTPTLTRNGGLDPGCCYDPTPGPPAEPPVVILHNFDEVLQDVQRVVNYLVQIIRPQL